MKLSPELWIKKKLGFLDEPRIILYRGFGNRRQVHVKGRILEETALAKPQQEQSKARNFVETAQRYFSGYYPNVTVVVSCGGQQKQLVSKDDGLFECTFHFDEPLKPGWIITQAHLAEEPDKLVCRGEALIADGDEGLGIISDIDDTVLISHTTEAMKALKLLLFRNARTRMPFAGARALYQALSSNSGALPHPTFYVSSSEWNLYDLLEEFFDHNQLPKGSFLLHDYRTSLVEWDLRNQERHNHKLQKIRLLLQTYPGRKFVLIGDSGQRDAEIYATVVEEYPERIKVVLIRHVSDALRAEAITELYDRMRQKHTPMFLVNNSLEAGRAAVRLGLMNEEDLNNIAQEMQVDTATAQNMITEMTQKGATEKS